MARMAPIFCMSVTLTLSGLLGGAGAALGQTVADFDAALAAAPVAGAKPVAAEPNCRPLLNYVYTSIEPGRRADWVLPLVTLSSGANPDVLAKRATCNEVRQQAVIRFDAGTGEEIVTPPQLTEVTTMPSAYSTNLPNLNEDRPAQPGDFTPAQPRRPLRRAPGATP